MCDAIDHQHVVDGQLRVTGPEQFAHTAGHELGFIVLRLRHKGLFGHGRLSKGASETGRGGAPLAGTIRAIGLGIVVDGS